jgi:cytosine/adenosine deaminase-related metal-dependent hydrolase
MAGVALWSWNIDNDNLTMDERGYGLWGVPISYAHTRANAPFLFQEGNLGSLAPGKYADLLELDRDYLTVPADEIKDIKPVLTMVGGKIVYDANRK